MSDFEARLRRQQDQRQAMAQAREEARAQNLVRIAALDRNFSSENAVFASDFHYTVGSSSYLETLARLVPTRGGVESFQRSLMVQSSVFNDRTERHSSVRGRGGYLDGYSLSYLYRPPRSYRLVFVGLSASSEDDLFGAYEVLDVWERGPDIDQELSIGSSRDSRIGLGGQRAGEAKMEALERQRALLDQTGFVGRVQAMVEERIERIAASVR